MMTFGCQGKCCPDAADNEVNEMHWAPQSLATPRAKDHVMDPMLVSVKMHTTHTRTHTLTHDASFTTPCTRPRDATSTPSGGCNAHS